LVLTIHSLTKDKYCPKCGRATYLHHQYKHYNRYKYGSKKCNHVIVQYHNVGLTNLLHSLKIRLTSLKKF